MSSIFGWVPVLLTGALILIVDQYLSSPLPKGLAAAAGSITINVSINFILTNWMKKRGDLVGASAERRADSAAGLP